ncbi:MAG: hypothetical protein JWQ85_4431, partial [Mucilaginibacter sp.]|nr:hypothetical protein [Mucilaginibacter sp.]
MEPGQVFLFSINRVLLWSYIGFVIPYSNV